MKIPKTLGRRALLKLSALGILPAAAAAAPRRLVEEHEHAPARYQLRLVGHSGNESSVHAPLTDAVADVLEPCLAVPKDEPTRLELVRTALKTTFGREVSELMLPPEYIVIWRDGEWVVVCLDQLRFQVGFNREGTVELAVVVDEMIY